MDKLNATTDDHTAIVFHIFFDFLIVLDKFWSVRKLRPNELFFVNCEQNFIDVK